MPPHRYRIFTHEGTTAGGNNRKPFGNTSEAELNSHPEKGDLQQYPRVRKLMNKHTWGFNKPRAVSTPPSNSPEQAKHTNEHRGPEDPTVKSYHQIPAKPSLIIPPRSQIASDRSVYFSKIPSTVGLSSIIAQSSGGPLERIEMKEESRETVTIELHFLHPANSTSFFNYATTGRFVVNGQSYYPYRNHSHNYNIKSRAVLEEMLYKGARRCLTLKLNNKLEHKKQQATATNYNINLGLSLDWIKRKFEKLGPIVSIQPMVTAMATISIQYTDVRSAIKAKELFDKKQDDWAKFHARWTLKYGKDPVDKTCPAPLCNY